MTSATDRSIAVEERSAPLGHSSNAHPLLQRWQALEKFGFPLFLLINAALFIRPTEVIPQMLGWPLYETLFIACLVVSVRPILLKLAETLLQLNPISVCVVALPLAAVASHLSHLHLRQAVISGIEVSKLVLYFLLLITLINTSARLRAFVAWAAIVACVQIGLAVMQYHGAIDLPALRPEQELTQAAADGETVAHYRICGSGIFNDPNDLGVLAAVAAVMCLYRVNATFMQRGRGRWIVVLLWLGLLGLSVHGLMLTQSRGAFIAMLAAVGSIGLVRLGWKKSLAAAVIVLPLMLIVFAGRQTNISVHRATAQSRMGIWAQAFSLFAGAPIFGIGQGEFRRIVGIVTHNTFLHCFTEMGVFGGVFFLGAFYVSAWSIFRLQTQSADADLSRLRPYLLGMIAAWVAGMMTLSRPYVPPTYMMLGLSAVFLGLIAKTQSLPPMRLDKRLMAQFVAVSAVYLVGMYLVVRIFHGA